MLLEGKKGLVMGIANERSIAWGIAHEAYQNGAKLCLTYQNDLFKERIDKLASSINCEFILKCDVENQTSIKKLFNEISNVWGEIDFIVHAMAFSDKNELKVREHEWVSRGGIKLDYALKHFDINILDKSCIDIGCSTGGFTDVLLHRKAKKIFCIDVGYGQLAWKIRNNEKVVVYEKFNAKNITLSQIGIKLDILVCDVSFISIKKIIPNCLKILKKNAILIILIKPQFEAGKEQVGKGGVVRDSAVHQEVIENVQRFGTETLGFTWNGHCTSPIKGPAGNIEFLAYWTT